MLLAGEALAQAGGETLGPCISNGTEGDLDGGQGGIRTAALDAIESRDPGSAASIFGIFTKVLENDIM